MSNDDANRTPLSDEDIRELLRRRSRRPRLTQSEIRRRAERHRKRWRLRVSKEEPATDTASVSIPSDNDLPL